MYIKLGRTPLLLAIKLNHNECVRVYLLVLTKYTCKILLWNRANPWSKDTLNYKELAKKKLFNIVLPTQKPAGKNYQ